MSVSKLFQNGKKPNILIIITDQERKIQHWPESFSKDNLPAMERLKRHGLDFNHHYTNACMCSPSRSTLLTSQYPVKTGVTRTGSPGPPRHLPTTIPNLATILKQAGYPRVEWHGKWHVGKTPADYGFEGWQPPDAGNYLAVNDTLGGGTPDNDGRFLRDLCHSLEQYHRSSNQNNNHNNSQSPEEEKESPESQSAEAGGESEQATTAATHRPEPFCVVASFVNPHDVYVAQHGPAKGYTAEDMHKIEVPLPSNHDEDTDENGKPRAHGQMSHKYVPFECTEQEYVNFYAYLHTLVDAQIGNLLDKVDELGFTESTLILRTADHGEQGLSHSLVEKFFNCYQESLNIPLVVSNPIAYPQPQTTDALSSHLDILPTLAGLLGHTDTDSLQGTNLAAVLDDPHLTTTVEVGGGDSSSNEGDSDTTPGDNSDKGDTNVEESSQADKKEITFPGIQKSIHFTYDDISFPGAPSTIRCLHKGTLKYAVYFTPNGRDADWELYDLQSDPLEDNNLAGKPEYKELQKALDRELFDTMVEKETLPTTFRWPPRPTRYSQGFDHPPGGKLEPRRRPPRPEPEEDPIKSYKFTDEGESVSVALGMDNIGTKCSVDEGDIELIVAGELVALIIKNYLSEVISLSLGKPKATIADASVRLEENELIMVFTKEDPGIEWKSFQE